MRAKRGYGKEVADIKAQLQTLRRSIHGFVFNPDWMKGEHYITTTAKIAELEARLKGITV